MIDNVCIVMKQRLKELYREHVSKFEQIVRNTSSFPMDVAGPLLISPNNLYRDQRTRLLVIGQETNGWGYFSNDVEAGMTYYEEFGLGVEYYSSPFWNVTRKVERLLGNDEYSCVWTNISKFDMDAGRPLGNVLTEVMTVDNLLIKEIEILQPDLIIFFTGLYFDFRIKRIFPDIRYKPTDGFRVDQLAEVQDSLFPGRAVRTYHPNFLRRSRLEAPFLKFLNELVYRSRTPRQQAVDPLKED